MKYRLLNEVLIEWNESPKEDLDNVLLKSEDIKKFLERCFIYKLNEKDQIKIFDADWPELEKYKDKVWINDKHVELDDDDEGWTVDEFEPGEYRVYIEDIDKVTDMTYMFFECRLVSAFIPNSITSIGVGAFQWCTNLTRVTIPNSVTSIGKSAFCYCSGLTSVSIGNSVTIISSNAFYECTDLSSITIPNSVTHIGDDAFSDCYSLTSITIPNSVIEIEESAFWGCNNLQTVYVEDINKFNQIKFRNESSNPTKYGAKIVELKK